MVGSGGRSISLRLDERENSHLNWSGIMNGRTAGVLFLVVCVGLSILSLAGMIAPLVAGGIFAGALVFFGGFSLAFRRHRKLTEREEEKEEERELEMVDKE